MTLKPSLMLAPLLALGLSATPAFAENAPAQHEARIPLANHGGIRDWRDGGQDTDDLSNSTGGSAPSSGRSQAGQV